MTLTIPDALTFILPLIITGLSHFLRDAKLSPAINGLIALGAILVTAVACVWLSGSWTGNMHDLTLLVMAYVGYLARNDFQALMSWLFIKDSPIAPSQPQAEPTALAPSGTFAYRVDPTVVKAPVTSESNNNLI